MKRFVVSACRNAASYPIFGRGWDDSKDGLRRETPHWCCGLLMMLTLLGVVTMALGATFLTMTALPERAQKTMEQYHQEWNNRLWPESVEEYVAKMRNTTMMLRVAVNKTKPDDFMVRVVEGRFRAIEETHRRFGTGRVAQIAYEGFLKMKEAWCVSLEDGEITEEERKFLYAMIMSYFPDEVYDQMNEEAKMATVNQLFETDQQLAVMQEVNKANEAVKYEDGRKLYENTMGMDAPYQIAYEYASQYLGIHGMIFSNLILLFCGMEVFFLCALLMHIHAHWRSCMYVMHVTADVMVRQPSMMMWTEFVLSLFLGKGTPHLPLYVAFIASLYLMPLTKPFFAWIVYYLDEKIKNDFKDKSTYNTWSYMFYHSMSLVLQHRAPLFWLALIPCFTNVFSNLAVVLYLMYVDIAMEGVQFMGLTLAQIEQAAKLKMMQLQSYASHFGVFLILALFFWYMSSKCFSAWEIITRKPGDRRALEKKYPRLCWILPFLKSWYEYGHGWVPLIPIGGMTLLHGIEFYIPEWGIDVEDGGLPVYFFKKVVSALIETQLFLSSREKMQIMETEFY